MTFLTAASAVDAQAPEAPQRFLGPTPVGDFYGPMQSMEDLKFSGVVRQRFDFSCGSAALATLLSMYGKPTSEATTFRGMWAGGDREQIRKLGFSLLDMKRFLASRQLAANGYKVTLADVEKAQVPGIALITVRNYKHFVVVEGVRAREVLVGDPSLGLRATPRADFEKSWNGVFFVIESRRELSRTRFNLPARWAQYRRAPMGSRFSDPLSLQALSLTAPFYGDF